MFIENRNLEWLNLNGQRNYPLAEGMSAIDISGSVKLPTDFIVDLQLSIHVNGLISVEKFHLLSVSSFSTGVVIEMGYDGTLIGTASINKNTFTRNKSYPIVFTGDFSDARGLVTIGSLQAVMETIPGAITFSLANARIEPSIIKRALKGVTGVYVRDSSELSSLYQGDVVIKAGLNVTLVATPVGDTTTIVINAIPGEGEQDPNANQDENGNQINPLLTINGILPDAQGNFVFNGDDCINFSSAAFEVLMNNECSQPCCGCDDLAAINTELELVRLVVDTINMESGRLAAEIQSIAINLVATKTDGPPTEVDRMVQIIQALLANADAAADCVPACPPVEPGGYFIVDSGDDFLLDDGEPLIY